MILCRFGPRPVDAMKIQVAGSRAATLCQRSGTTSLIVNDLSIIRERCHRPLVVGPGPFCSFCRAEGYALTVLIMNGCCIHEGRKGLAVPAISTPYFAMRSRMVSELFLSTGTLHLLKKTFQTRRLAHEDQFCRRL